MNLVKNYALDQDIEFSGTSVGFAVATITSGSLFWSDISGIRRGYRILLPNNGEAVLLEDPTFQSKSINVEIISVLDNTSYLAGNWEVNVPLTREIKEYLPRDVRRTLLIPNYLDSLQKVSINELQDAIIRLRNIRRWSVMDEDYLDLFLQTMGMFIRSEEFDTETRRRFIKELPAFIQLSGTKFFINYLSFVIGADFEIIELWSNDYKNFIEKDEIPVGQESTYYPTNHVELNFNANVFGILDVSTIIDTFYILASVPLVLDRIVQKIEDELLIQPTFKGAIRYYYTGKDITPEFGLIDPNNPSSSASFNTNNTSNNINRFGFSRNDQNDLLNVNSSLTSYSIIRYNNTNSDNQDSLEFSTGMQAPSNIIRN